MIYSQYLLMHLKRHYLQQVLTKENSDDDGGDENDESNDYEFSDDEDISKF